MAGHSSPSGPVLNGPLPADQLMQILYGAGFRGQSLQTAFAIARAESSGDPHNRNPDASTGDNSYGLFQINMLGQMGVDRLREYHQKYGINSYDDLYNPVINAKIAFDMSGHGKHWGDWSTHPESKARGGAGVGYEKYLGEAQKTYQQLSTSKTLTNMPAIAPVPTTTGSSGTQATTGYQAPSATGNVSNPYNASNPGDLGLGTTTTDPAAIRKYAESHYGYLAGFLNMPEVGAILIKAAQEGWDQQTLAGELTKTNWWKNTANTARVWDAQAKTDPETTEQAIAQQAQYIGQKASQTGVILGRAALANLATQSLRLGWTQSQTDAAIGAHYVYNAQHPVLGTATTAVDQLKAMAADYVIPISDHTLGQFAQQIASGQKTVNDYQSYFKQQALSLYPTLEDSINSGMSVKTYMNPYMQIASQTLDKPVDSFDLMDPQWNKAINQIGPDGKRGPMSLSDWTTSLRQRPEYAGTKQANDLASQATAGLLQTFGFTG